MIFKPAQLTKAKLRLAITGPSGGGKTYSALAIASAFPGKIAIIDTEEGSSPIAIRRLQLDTGETLGASVETLGPPFTTERYIALIKGAENEGYTTLIIDSITHAWIGVGGLLDQQNRFAKKQGVNEYTAWRDITPKHNAFVDAMLQSKCNIIATMRSKQDHILEENSRGKMVPKKVGMAPIQRPGMDYEFTVCFDMTMEHYAVVSKDRTGLFDGEAPSIPTKETGAALYDWLESGADAPAPEPISEANGKSVADIVRWIETATRLDLEDRRERLENTVNDLATSEQLVISNALEDRKLELQQLEAENPPH